jgi:hypothetical protein
MKGRRPFTPQGISSLDPFYHRALRSDKGILNSGLPTYSRPRKRAEMWLQAHGLLREA